MTADSALRARALLLRDREGLTPDAIASRLALPRWRVDDWLQHALTYALRDCAYCREPFAPVTAQQRFCCRAHQQEHARRLRRCRHCHERFVADSDGQRFCSPAHEQEHARQRRTPAAWRDHVERLEAEVARLRALAQRNAA
jgi:hypothetical protein